MMLTIYTLPLCQQCTATKRWLEKRGVPYVAIDLADSPADAAAVAALGYKQAPVIIVSNGDPETDLHWGGFDPNNLERYVGSLAA
jgi:glutaredoxin-like protein NrdH